MKKSICEITGRQFDCKNCDVPELNEKGICPAWTLDDAIATFTKEIRKYVMESLSKKQNNENLN